MIRALLDTNVLASGIVGIRNAVSTPGRIMRAWRDNRFSLIVSEHILNELSRTLLAPYFRRRLSSEQISEAAALLRAQAVHVSLEVQVHGIASHPEDDLVLATAVSAKVDYLVTGDGALQQLGTYGGVTILSPRAFLELLEPPVEDATGNGGEHPAGGKSMGSEHR